MNILIVGVNYTPEVTGIAPYTTAMAEGLRNAGHRVRVITGVPHYPQWENFTNFSGLTRTETIRGVPVRRVAHYIGHGGTGLGRILQEVSFGVMAALQPWGRPDAVLCVSPALIASGIVAARAKLTRVPVGVWVQDLYSNGMREIGERGLQSRLLWRLESGVLRFVDGVSVIHDRFARHVTDDLGVPAERVSVSRNWSHLVGGETADVHEIRRRYFGNARVVALHTGNMGAKQGLENVVDAARLAERRGSDVVFGLVGSGSRREILERYGRGVKNLVFVPSLEDPEYRAILKCADVLIVNEKPGLRESAVPSKLTSYFVQGTPVVAATEADSVTADEVRTAGAGPVVRPGRPDELLDAVEELAGSDGTQFGANAQRFAAENLTAASAISRVERWLRTLSRGGRTPLHPTASERLSERSMR